MPISWNPLKNYLGDRGLHRKMNRAIENKLESEQNESFLDLSIVLVSESLRKKARVPMPHTAIRCMIAGELHNGAGPQL